MLRMEGGAGFWERQERRYVCWLLNMSGDQKGSLGRKRPQSTLNFLLSLVFVFASAGTLPRSTNLACRYEC